MPIDYSEYPPNWKTEIRPRIIARAKNCCEDCGIPNQATVKRKKDGTYRFLSAAEWDLVNGSIKYGQYSKAGALKKHGFTKVVLTIAHLNHDKLNWDVKDEDLKALCQRCHLLLDINHHTTNRKYGRNHARKEQLKLI